MIELTEVTKLYGTVIGVNDINLSLPVGMYGLLGPNGSGKTTLINLILGQLQPTLGQVRLFGANPWARDWLLRRIGFCPAVEVTYPRVSGFEWVRYLVQMHGFGMREAGQRAKQALEQVHLTSDMYRPMRHYSLGMRQRAKLAQAIAHDPELLILDEPFNGLDPIGRSEMIQFLKAWGQRGRSLILASHILHEVESVNPSFLLISGGRLLASGSPEHVRALLSDTPNTLRIQCDEPRKLASRLMSWPDVLEVAIETGSRSDSTDWVRVATLSAARVFERLPDLVTEQEIEIRQMVSTDESLGNLFSTLMRIHRGESQGGPLT